MGGRQISDVPCAQAPCREGIILSHPERRTVQVRTHREVKHEENTGKKQKSMKRKQNKNKTKRKDKEEGGW
jgi:hypothetical protein